jgi:hypothetical protein
LLFAFFSGLQCNAGFVALHAVSGAAPTLGVLVALRFLAELFGACPLVIGGGEPSWPPSAWARCSAPSWAPLQVRAKRDDLLTVLD